MAEYCVPSGIISYFGHVVGKSFDGLTGGIACRILRDGVLVEKPVFVPKEVVIGNTDIKVSENDRKRLLALIDYDESQCQDLGLGVYAIITGTTSATTKLFRYDKDENKAYTRYILINASEETTITISIDSTDSEKDSCKATGNIEFILTGMYLIDGDILSRGYGGGYGLPSESQEYGPTITITTDKQVDIYILEYPGVYNPFQCHRTVYKTYGFLNARQFEPVNTALCQNEENKYVAIIALPYIDPKLVKVVI